MLQSYPTKRGTGISILGSYADLDILYGTIHHLAQDLDERGDRRQEAQVKLLMNFAYEVRKAFSGQRLVEKRTYGGDRTEHTLYGFQLVWTDILIFLSALRHRAGYSQSGKLHQAILYNLEHTVEASLFEYDPVGACQIKGFIGQRINITDEYAFIIYQALHIKYVTEKAGKNRFRRIPQLLAEHFSSWGDAYKDLIASFELSAREQNCGATELEFSDFPEISW